jgi:hypothetical protein
MKIHEIISEDRIVTEANLLGKAGKWALGKVANTVARSGAFKPNEAKVALDKLSAEWAKEIETNGKIVTPANKIIGASAQDAKLVKDAEKNAKKAAAETATAQNTQSLKKYASALGTSGMAKVNKLITLGIVVAPIYEYLDRMQYCDAQYASGAWTQNEYVARKRQELSVMLGTMALGMTGWAGIKSIGFASGWLLGWLPGFKPVMSLLTSAGAVAATAWLNSDEGRYWIAQVFANDVFEGGKYDISPLIGGGAERIINKFRSLVPGFNAITPTDATEPNGQKADAGAKADQASTSATGNVAGNAAVQPAQATKSVGTGSTGMHRTADGDITFDESKQRHLRGLR